VNTPHGQQMVETYVELYTRWGKPKEAEVVKAQFAAAK
jgi:hypothetical protein